MIYKDIRRFYVSMRNTLPMEICKGTKSLVEIEFYEYTWE